MLFSYQLSVSMSFPRRRESSFFLFPFLLSLIFRSVAISPMWVALVIGHSMVIGYLGLGYFFVIWNSSLIRNSSFEIRHSSFGIRHLLFFLLPTCLLPTCLVTANIFLKSPRVVSLVLQRLCGRTSPGFASARGYR